MKYEIQATWGGVAWRQEGQQDDPTPAEMRQSILAAYETAAIRGGRVVANYTLILDGREHLFFVSEHPDEPIPADHQ